MKLSSEALPRVPTRRVGLALLVALGCITTVQEAFSGTQEPDARSTRVIYADLDLSSPDGVRTLYGRIHRAASRVCNLSSLHPYLNGSGDCYRLAVAAAVARVDNAMLTVLHRPKT